jgi:outer membrane immunogenic protein
MARNFKPLLLSPLGLLPLAAGQAEAADLPVKARAPVSDPYSPLWNGWYGGVHLGALSARSSQSPFVPTAAQAPGGGYCWSSSCAFSNTQNALGVLAGVQLGYNFQFQQFVYGIETDISYSNAKKNTTGVHAAPFGFLGPWSADNGVNAFGTTRLRFGYTFDRTLVYATGGVAYASVRDQFTAGASTVVQRFTTSTTGWRWGWTAGLGAEYSIARNWSVKAEGLYYDLGSKAHVSNDNFGEGWGLYDRMTGVIGRIGLNYQFH